MRPGMPVRPGRTGRARRERPAAVTPEGDLAEVVRRERRLLDPAVRCRPEEVEGLLHPEFVEIGSSGKIWDRPAIIAALSADPAVPGEPVDVEPRRLCDDVVLVTYQVTGAPSTLRSSVWVRGPVAGWRLRFHQGTVAP